MKAANTFRNRLTTCCIVFLILTLFTSCRAANDLIGVYLPFIPGNRLEAPTISLGSESVLPGGTVTLTSSTSLEDVVFYWSIIEGEGTIGETGDSVVYTAGTSPGITVISCYASKEGYPDSETAEASVTVTEAPALPAPVITPSDGINTVFTGRTSGFSASGSGSGVTYHWSVSGSGSITSSGTSVSYTAPSTEEAAVISCYASADGYTDSNTTTLAISVKANYYASLTSTTGTVSGSNINQASPTSLTWSSSSFNSDYFDHSVSVNPERLIVKQDGNYFIALTIPMSSALERSCVKAEVYVHGTAVNGSVAESSYIRNNVGDHSESSDHLALLLDNLSANDYIEVKVSAAAIAGTVSISGRATLYAEYIESSQTVFSASATGTTSSTNLNQDTAYPLEWTEKVKTTGYTHSNAASPENITLDEAGYYLVFVNVPLNTVTLTYRFNVKLLVQLNGTVVPGGEGKQGYIRGESGHQDSSIHWSGMIYSSGSGGTLNILTQKETNTSTGTVTTGAEEASLFILKIDTSSLVLFSQATELTGGTNWNPVTEQAVKWSTDSVIDTNLYSHSTASSPEEIVINRTGDYLLIYNDSLQYSAPVDPYRYNPKITVKLGGVSVSGAETKSHYLRVETTTGNFESSGSLVYYLKDVDAGETLTVTVSQEAAAATVLADRSALLVLIRKQ